MIGKMDIATYDASCSCFWKVMEKGIMNTFTGPVVIRGMDIGLCREKWTPSYLAKVIQSEVTIHVSKVPRLNFIEKNFEYRKCTFSTLIDMALSSEANVYMRSLGNDHRKDVADTTKDFPDLMKDVATDNILQLLGHQIEIFSSVLRLSSKGLQLWTHYDVMPNILIQIVGQKRVVLFNPDDTPHMYLKGDKSTVLDIDNPDLTEFPSFVNAVQHEVIIEPGDILYIPAFWFHNVTALDLGVAINFFFKDPCHEKYYDDKDLYGNKDFPIAAQAIKQTDKAIKLLMQLPLESRRFYAQRLISNITSGIVAVPRDRSLTSEECRHAKQTLACTQCKRSTTCITEYKM